MRHFDLNFLHSHPRTFLTLDDVAYHLARPIEEIERDLQKLTQLQLVQTQRVTLVTFYALTREPAKQQLAHELCAWQQSWETRLHELALLIGNHHPSITFTTPQALRRRQNG